MLEKIMTALDFAFRQKEAVREAAGLLKQLFTFKIPFKSIFATFLTVFELIGAGINDTPITPHKEALDLTGYELVFEDDFNGNELDLSKWSYRSSGKQRSGYMAPSQVSVKDGNLVFTGEYLADGEYGEGWYGGSIRTNEEFCRGYYEIRCIINEDSSNKKNFWAAFWMTNDVVYKHDVSKGGPGGCEIDIMEAMSGKFKTKRNKNAVSHCLWCNGYDSDPETTDGRNLGQYKGNNIYEEYNTYGLKWTEDEYIFYVNGIETVRSTFGKGVSKAPEYIIVSLGIPTKEIEREKDFTATYTVDYVKIYQIPED